MVKGFLCLFLSSEQKYLYFVYVSCVICLSYLHASLYLSLIQLLDINWTGLTNILDIPGIK